MNKYNQFKDIAYDSVILYTMTFFAFLSLILLKIYGGGV